MEVLYKYDKEIAKQNGEIEICIKSFKQNKECAKAIDKALNENFSDNRLNVDKVIDTVVADFGIERVTHVLSAQVVNHDWDGRYHNDVKGWAKEQMKGFTSEFIEESRNYYLTAHPILIGGLSSTVMERQKELEKSTELKKTSEFIDTAISESKVSENQYKLNKALNKVSEQYSDEEISAALSSEYCKSHPKLIKKFSEKLSERKQANEQVMVLEDECTRRR